MTPLPRQRGGVDMEASSVEPVHGLQDTTAATQVMNRYRAPALEKGLDVLELMSKAAGPMTLSQISSRQERSVSELFRMLQVLESRGYVQATSGGYELTNKLFTLGLGFAPTHDLVEAALPAMHELSAACHQSCHLAVASTTAIVVIAKVDSPGDMGFSVRMGQQHSFLKSASGIVLYAFLSNRKRREMAAAFGYGASADGWSLFESRAEESRARGFSQVHNSCVNGILDMACPIYTGTVVAASLGVPYFDSAMSLDQAATLSLLQATAKAISLGLGTRRSSS